MTDLLPEEGDALVKALENGGELESDTDAFICTSLTVSGLIHMSSVSASLTPAGEIVSTLLKESLSVPGWTQHRDNSDEYVATCLGCGADLTDDTEHAWVDCVKFARESASVDADIQAARISELESQIAPLRDAPPPSDLTRAQELLREWREAANIAEEHRALPAAQLCWEDGHGWYASLEWPVNDARLGWHTVSGPGPSDPNPLAAVRAAIAMTPWGVDSPPLDV